MERDPVNIELEKHEALKAFVRKVRQAQKMARKLMIEQGFDWNLLPAVIVEWDGKLLEVGELEAELDEVVK